MGATQNKLLFALLGEQVLCLHIESLILDGKLFVRRTRVELPISNLEISVRLKFEFSRAFSV